MGRFPTAVLCLSLLDLKWATHGRGQLLLEGTFAAFHLSLLERWTAGTSFAVIEVQVLLLILSVYVLSDRQLEGLIEDGVDAVLLALGIDRLVDECVSVENVLHGHAT